jgi:hypothetical protein
VEGHSNDVAERLGSLLGPEGMGGTAGAGPEIAVSAVSPRAKEILLTALLALQKEKNWHGRLRAVGEPFPPGVSTLLVVGLTPQLPSPVLTLQKPFLSSLEVVDLQGAAKVDYTLFFTELTLAAQLFVGSEQVDFRLERLGRSQAKFSLKSYDRASHEAFLDQLKKFLATEEAGQVQLHVSKPFLEGLPERSSALRLRSFFSDRYPGEWYEAPRMDFFEPLSLLRSGEGLPVAPASAQTVNLWMAEDTPGPQASEELYHALLELLDSSPK